ncbi:MAG: glycoside hydrolase domain-containing protein [Armatimonadia bacterium]
MRYLLSLLAISISLSSFAAPARNQNLLLNPGFEQATKPGSTAWQPYNLGYSPSTTARHGHTAISCASTSPQEIRGAMQEVVFDPPLRHSFRISGWSKAENASGQDYCLYLDCFYDDGTPLWGQRTDFSQGTHDWEYVENTFTPAKPIAKIQYFILFRRCTGKVWFDDVSLSLSPFELEAERIFPSLYGSNTIEYTGRLSLPGAWTGQILRDGREVYTQSGKGTGLTLSWSGEDPSGTPLGPGPYQLRLTAKDDLLGEQLTIDRTITTTNTPRRGYVAWTESSMDRVLINRLPEVKRELLGRVSLARNEYESFQVALRTAPNVELRDCRVTLPDLTGPGGARLTSNCLQWQQVGFVDIKDLSPSTVLPEDAVPGWWPDPLLPVSRFNVKPAMTQSLWFTVYAPPGTRPGVYTGQVTITPANAPALQVPVQATVYDFDIPTQGHLKTAFALMDGYLERLYGPLTPELRRKYGDFALKHHLNPDDISRTDPPDLDDLAYYNDHGLNAFNVINMVEPRGKRTWVCYSDLGVYTPTFKQQLIERLDPYVAELKRRGLYEKAYVYTFDERGKEFYPIMKEYFGLIKERYGLPTLTTAKVPQEPQAMRDLNIDWNCPVSSVYNFQQAEQCRKAGLKVWSYVCCGPRRPYANFLGEDELIQGRLIWWQAYHQKMDGFLYWGLNIWGRSNNNYLIDPEKDGPFLKWSITTGGQEQWLKCQHGDGELLYAGKEGPIGCIRLANLRDGLEDYEYLYLLASKQGGLEAARKACEPVTTSLTAFTHDPAVLAQQRDRLARLITAAHR